MDALYSLAESPGTVLALSAGFYGVYRTFMRFCSIAALACFAVPAIAQSALHLIPMPREVVTKADRPLPDGVTIECAGCDLEDQFAADDLKKTLGERGLSTSLPRGLRIVFRRVGSGADSRFTDAMRAEGYTISSSADALTLSGASASGVFYAAQTVKQMLERRPDGTWVLDGADIRDWPAMKYRGLHDDLSRGPVDTLEFQKKMIRTLAAYKANLYSPYFEHTQQYAANPFVAPPDASISPADARELTAYAAKYHVIVVPEQEAFGHLRHTLMWEKFVDIVETPHGALISPGQPGSLAFIHQMFSELATMYPGPFLHVGGDETSDLGLGRTRADVDSRGLAPVYLDFMQRIVTDLQPLHRKILFWGDVAQDAPAQVKALPQSFKDNTIAIAWGYTPRPEGFSKAIKPFSDAGLEMWVAPSINNYRQVYPNQQLGLDDIQEFTRDGQSLGATGQLNTLWDDDGESLANCNWYGILFGATAAWQHGESSIPAFQTSYGPVFHGDNSGLLNEAENELTAAMTLLTNTKVIGATEGSDGLFWVDPWSKDGQGFAEKMRPISSPLRLHAERALTLVAQARAGNTNLRETEAMEAMEFGARRIDFLGLKFQLADEMASGYAQAYTESSIPMQTLKHIHPGPAALLSDINGVNGRLQDLIDGYAQLRDLYEKQWLSTYRPGGLRPVLERYDFAIATWLTRVDAVRSAQRQWSSSRSLPTAVSVGIAPPAAPVVVPQPSPVTR